MDTRQAGGPKASRCPNRQTLCHPAQACGYPRQITRPLTLGGIQPRLTVQDAIDVLGLGEMGIRPMSDATRNRKQRRKAA